ncbi:MAG: hypothetical protein SFU99_00175 [Saprospiraceae bacterium]|nr:hypothetical protein [Saprospiraceae bacterium]
MKPWIFYAAIFTLVLCVCFNTLHAQESTEEEIEKQKKLDRLRLEQDLRDAERRPAINFGEDIVRVRDILQAQDQDATVAISHKKVDKALKGFLETEFMTKYKDLKLEAESLVGAFKVHSRDLHPSDVLRVQKAYARIADKFNMFLVELKDEFMDKKTLKYIQEQPEMYSNAKLYKLNELKDEYSQDFQLVVAEVTGSELYSAVPVVVIIELIRLAVDLSNYIVKLNFESRRVKEEELREFFLIPYSFRNWDDILEGQGDIYRVQGNQNGQQEEPNPFEEETNSAKPKPKKKNNDQ